MKHIVVSLTLIMTVIAGNAQTFADARREFQNENYFRAKQYLLKLHAQDKANEQVTYYLANAYLKLEETDSANYFYQLMAEGKSPMALIAKAKLALNRNDMTLAKELVEKAITKNGDKDPEIYYQAGWAYFEPKPVDLKQAIEYFEMAVKKNYNNALYQMALGEAYSADGNPNDMNKYEAAAEVSPTFALPHLKIARAYSQGRLYDMAIQSYLKSIELDPNLAVSYKELGQLYVQTKDYKKAAEYYKKYVELTPDDKSTKIALAYFLYQIREYQQAAEESQKILNDDSTSYQAYRVLAYAQYELKQYPQATITINKFWKYGEGKKINATDYAYAARIANINNDTITAFQCFKKSIAMDTTNGVVIGEYAKALYANQHFAEAAPVFKRHYSTYDGSDLDIYYMGRSYYGANDFVNADSSFAWFTRRQPKSPEGYLWRAKSNLRMETGKTLQGFAVPHYEKYIEVAKSDPKNNSNIIDGYYYIALYYVGQKQVPKAKEYLNNILALDPNHKDTKDLLNTLK